MKITMLLLVALTGTLHAQGPLDPPAGPAPTMKSLDQIEPRTPISSLPYTISESGSYYFTGNLVFTEESGSAIRINASYVTLDLMGFTLSSTPSVIGDGISISGRHIKICNGHIKGNTTVERSGDPATWTTTRAGFDYGIRYTLSYASFSDLTIEGMRSYGLSAGAYATVDNIRSYRNGNRGIDAPSGSVTNSVATLNGGSGISVVNGSVINSVAQLNGLSGIVSIKGSATNCTSAGNGINGILANYGSVTGCAASGNSDIGISADQGSVSNSSASENGGDGISASDGSVVDSHASENGDDGIEARNGSISNSTASANARSGISAFSGNVTGCSASDNGSDGIYATTGTVTHSTASSNVSYDISASNAVVAFCRFTTFLMFGSSLTGNFPSP